MTKAEADALKAQIDYYAQLTEDRINAGEILIVENDTPNVSLKVIYNEAKNCTEVRLNAWHPLNEDEVKAIKEFITKRKETARKPYPLGGFGGKVVGMETTNGEADLGGGISWALEEAGPIDRETFNKLKPFTFGVDYATPGKDRTAWAVVGELSEEAKAAFREAVEKNFNKGREFKVGPLVYGWELGHTAEDEADRLIDIKTLYGRYRSSKGLSARFSWEEVKDLLDFAKLVRVLTIQETTEGISARLKKPRWENDITPVPWVDRRPDENLILLPKDFTL